MRLPRRSRIQTFDVLQRRSWLVSAVPRWLSIDLTTLFDDRPDVEPRYSGNADSKDDEASYQAGMRHHAATFPAASAARLQLWQ